MARSLAYTCRAFCSIVLILFAQLGSVSSTCTPVGQPTVDPSCEFCSEVACGDSGSCSWCGYTDSCRPLGDCPADACAASVTLSVADVPLPLADATTTTFTFAPFYRHCPIISATLDIDVSHGRVGDLNRGTLVLGATRLTLWSVLTNILCLAQSLIATFDDSSTFSLLSLIDLCPPLGLLKPVDPLATLVGFDANTDVSGAFSLELRDGLVSATGNLQSAQLHLTCDCPSLAPTASPTTLPTATPTVSPTVSPTFTPTPGPTRFPTPVPSPAPTLAPGSPTATPTLRPTVSPTVVPSRSPTPSPTPGAVPTLSPVAPTPPAPACTSDTGAVSVNVAAVIRATSSERVGTVLCGWLVVTARLVTSDAAGSATKRLDGDVILDPEKDGVPLHRNQSLYVTLSEAVTLRTVSAASISEDMPISVAAVDETGSHGPAFDIAEEVVHVATAQQRGLTGDTFVFSCLSSWDNPSLLGAVVFMEAAQVPPSANAVDDEDGAVSLRQPVLIVLIVVCVACWLILFALLFVRRRNGGSLMIRSAAAESADAANGLRGSSNISLTQLQPSSQAKRDASLSMSGNRSASRRTAVDASARTGSEATGGSIYTGMVAGDAASQNLARHGFVDVLTSSSAEPRVPYGGVADATSTLRTKSGERRAKNMETFNRYVLEGAASRAQAGPGAAAAAGAALGTQSERTRPRSVRSRSDSELPWALTGEAGHGGESDDSGSSMRSRSRDVRHAGAGALSSDSHDLARPRSSVRRGSGSRLQSSMSAHRVASGSKSARRKAAAAAAAAAAAPLQGGAAATPPPVVLPARRASDGGIGSGGVYDSLFLADADDSTGTVRRGHRPVAVSVKGGQDARGLYDGVAASAASSSVPRPSGGYEIGPFGMASPEVDVSSELRTVDGVPPDRYRSPRGETLSNIVRQADDLSSSPGRRLTGRMGALRPPANGVSASLTIGSTGSSFVDEDEDDTSSFSSSKAALPTDALTARWDQALERGLEYSDDADAFDFLQPYEMDLPSWKRRVLVRERATAARQRAARRAREQRVRHHLMAESRDGNGGVDDDDESLTLADLDTVRLGSVVAPARTVSPASLKALRRIAKDMMSVLDEDGRDVLRHHVGEPAGRARALASAFAAAGPDWLALIVDHVDTMFGDAASAKRFAEQWLPSRLGHGTLANVISVIDQALSPDERGVTKRSLADAVRAGCQVILDMLQEVVPVCKLGGVPPNLYNKVVLQLGQDLMFVIIRTLLTDFDANPLEQ